MWWNLLVILPLAVILWLFYEWMEHALVQYVSTVVECQKLPADTELRLCLVSDLHNNKKDFKKLTAHIKDFAPEMILLAGDLVNKHKTDNVFAEQFLDEISTLDVPVFYSAGNHELSLMEEKPYAWKEFMEKLPKGIIYLENESVLCKFNSKEVCVTGLSLPKIFYKKGKLYDNKAELPRINNPGNQFRIMIAHHPEYASFYSQYQADFIVSGHLHGGLLRLPFFGGMVSPRFRIPNGYDAGVVDLNDGSKMFVSRGLGSHTIPLRFFNRVEVNFLVLKGTKE